MINYTPQTINILKNRNLLLEINNVYEIEVSKPDDYKNENLKEAKKKSYLKSYKDYLPNKNNLNKRNKKLKKEERERADRVLVHQNLIVYEKMANTLCIRLRVIHDKINFWKILYNVLRSDVLKNIKTDQEELKTLRQLSTNVGEIVKALEEKHSFYKKELNGVYIGYDDEARKFTKEELISIDNEFIRDENKKGSRDIKMNSEELQEYVQRDRILPNEIMYKHPVLFTKNDLDIIENDIKGLSQIQTVSAPLLNDLNKFLEEQYYKSYRKHKKNKFVKDRNFARKNQFKETYCQLEKYLFLKKNINIHKDKIAYLDEVLIPLSKANMIKDLHGDFTKNRSSHDKIKTIFENEFVKTETFFKEQGISVEDYKKMHDKLTISKNEIAEHVDLLKELTGETTEQNLQEDQNVLLKISYKNDKQNNSSSKHSGTLNPKGDSFSENMRTPQINSNGINQTEELKRLEKKKNQFLEFQKETKLKSDNLKELIERITNGKESDEIKELQREAKTEKGREKINELKKINEEYQDLIGECEKEMMNLNEKIQEIKPRLANMQHTETTKSNFLRNKM